VLGIALLRRIRAAGVKDAVKFMASSPEKAITSRAPDKLPVFDRGGTAGQDELATKMQGFRAGI
jgi:hypothetical protein